jgi:hypothetical protein
MAEDVREKERKKERERERETGLLDHFWPYVWAHVPCMTHCLQNRGGSFSAKTNLVLSSIKFQYITQNLKFKTTKISTF